MQIPSDVVAKKERAEAALLALPGVTAVDIGYKEVGGELTGQLAIRVHVAQKKARVANAEKVPTEIEGVVTDVLQRVYEPQVASLAVDAGALADTTHYTSLQGGISMGPSRVIGGFIFAGTLGAIVIDNANNQHAALTNFHVACVDSTWHVGDRMVQPSRIDTGVPPGDEFGAIVRATLSMNIDGALVSIDPGHANVCTIAEIGSVKGTRTATLGMAVRKRGRTTGLTYGSVDGLNSTVNVDYGDGIGVHTLSNQISIRTDTSHNPLFSDHGDSGSVIVDGDGYVVGLLFAGSGSNTVANPIAAVLSELNISMCSVSKSFLKDFIDTGGGKLRVKDHVKDTLKDVIKDHKEILKDIRDLLTKPFEFPPIPPPGPIHGGPFGAGGGVGEGFGQGGALEARLAHLEGQLGALTSYIGSELRPDLTGGTAGSDIDALRAALTEQAAAAAAAKAELDTPG